MKLYLARHGQTLANLHKLVSGQFNTVLSAKGKEQAIALADVLREQTVVEIYTSQLMRTQETAKYLASEKNLQLRVVPGFNEIHLGELQGRPLDGTDPDAISTLSYWEQHRDTYTVPGGERYADFVERVERDFQQVCSNAEWPILISGHRNTNEVIVKTVFGQKYDTMLPSNLNIKNKYLYEIDMGSDGLRVTTIRLGGQYHGQRYTGWRQ